MADEELTPDEFTKEEYELRAEMRKRYAKEILRADRNRIRKELEELKRVWPADYPCKPQWPN